VLLARGRHAEALAAAEVSLAARSTIGISSEAVKEAFAVAVEAAFELGDDDRTSEILAIVDRLPPGRSPHFLQAQSARFRARLAAAHGDASEAERLSTRAVARFRELSIPFCCAVTELEHAERLIADGRHGDAEPLLGSAYAVFERLEARPWLERVARASGQEVASLAP
jgi:hypothetical protein